MPIELSVEAKTGNQGNYWVIEEIRLNKKKKVLRATLLLFKSQSKYRKGVEPMKRVVKRFSFSDIGNGRAKINQLVDILEDIVLQLNEFSGGTKV